MEFSLKTNGADSLKKVKICIDLFESSEEQFSFHYLKDATIFLSHSIEVLLKYIISKRDESLIFSDFSKYINVKKSYTMKEISGGKRIIHLLMV